MGNGLRGLSVAAAIAACAIFAPAVSADATGGAISGVITAASSGQPLANVWVSANGPEASSQDHTCTGSDGSYTLSNLPSGDYDVEVDPGDACPGGSATYGGTELSASVSAPGTTSGVDAALVPTGTIQGTVTEASDAAPIYNDAIWVTPESGTYGSGGSACTDTAGKYTVRGLAAGEYKVEVMSGNCYGAESSSGFADQWYPNATDEASAQLVTVTSGATTGGIDGSLTPDTSSDAGLIRGTLTNAATGGPAADVSVIVESQYTNRYGETWLTTVGQACTNAAGNYVIDDLSPGSDTVVFGEEDGGICSGRFIPVEYRGVAAAMSHGGPQDFDAQQYADATPVSVTAGTETDGIDDSLQPAATISGTLVDAATGQPAAEASVEVYDAAGDEVGGACTNADGTYTTTIVPDGSYRIGFASDPFQGELCTAGNGPLATGIYLPAYYSQSSTLSGATPVIVQAPTDATGIDGRLTLGGKISGAVSFIGKPPMNECNIDVFNSAGVEVENYTAIPARGTTTATYIIGALAPGSYTVEFTAYQYETQYYAGTPVASAATPVQVSGTATTSNIDAVLVPTANTGTISGTVTSAMTRQPVAGVTVDVASPGGGPLEGTATTAVNGTYSISGVPAGSDTVVFSDPSGRYLTQFSPDSASLAHAQTVGVSGGQTVSGVDAALVPQAASRRAALVSPDDLTATRAGVLGLTLACPGTATCSGQVGISAPRATRADAPRLRRFAVATGQTTTVRFRLSRTQTRRLSARHLETTTVTLRDRVGTRRYVLSLRPPSRRPAAGRGSGSGRG